MTRQLQLEKRAKLERSLTSLVKTPVTYDEMLNLAISDALNNAMYRDRGEQTFPYTALAKLDGIVAGA